MKPPSSYTSPWLKAYKVGFLVCDRRQTTTEMCAPRRHTEWKHKHIDLHLRKNFLSCKGQPCVVSAGWNPLHSRSCTLPSSSCQVAGKRETENVNFELTIESKLERGKRQHVMRCIFMWFAGLNTNFSFLQRQYSSPDHTFDLVDPVRCVWTANFFPILSFR